MQAVIDKNSIQYEIILTQLAMMNYVDDDGKKLTQ